MRLFGIINIQLEAKYANSCYGPTTRIPEKPVIPDVAPFTYDC